MIGMAMLDLHPRVAATTILERRELADGVVLLTLHAPEIADATQPGQYLMAIPPSGEAAATALAVYEAEGKRASCCVGAPTYAFSMERELQNSWSTPNGSPMPVASSS
jgi:NAD(P)H-flavin reductase